MMYKYLKKVKYRTLDPNPDPLVRGMDSREPFSFSQQFFGSIFLPETCSIQSKAAVC
jgi:hypothetical protein